MRRSPRAALGTPPGRVLGAAGLVVTALVVAALVEVGGTPAPQSHGPTTVLTGTVLDELGRPVAGATVAVDGADAVTTDAAGEYRLEAADRPHVLAASAPGHLPRRQAVSPGRDADVRLTSEAERTVSMRFGGDTMFGRRYYDPRGDGTGRGTLLDPDSSVAEHAALLEHVRPLLEDADVTVVNLESPLVDEPQVDPRGSRPERFHATKELVFASAPAAAGALADAGVDVVSLANNHVYDVLGPGLAATLDALDRAGILRFGAGTTVEEAWEPAVVTRHDETVAFLGCTTVAGLDEPVPYVATATKGGAAHCTGTRLVEEVTAARERASTVVVMIHGGREYHREQTQLVRDLTAAAVAAGATVVVNGHPHVVGGVTSSGDALVAESVGNLLFDQTVWPTFLSYLLRVDVRRGTPVQTTIDPLLIEDYVPRPTVWPVADAAARVAAGVVPGPARLQGPGIVLDPVADDAATSTRRLEPGAVAHLSQGWWVAGATTGGAPPVVGEDLLWSTGGFEDSDVDPATAGGHLWTLGRGAGVVSDAACRGRDGVMLTRGPGSGADVVASPAHRQPVVPGDSVSLIADVRRAAPGSVLELRWYPGTTGPSSDVVAVEVPEGTFDGCRPVRIDAVVPPGIVAVQPFVRLAAPAGIHRAARFAVDDIRLVRWAPPGHFGRRFDTVSATDGATLHLQQDGAGVADPATAFASVTLPAAG